MAAQAAEKRCILTVTHQLQQQIMRAAAVLHVHGRAWPRTTVVTRPSLSCLGMPMPTRVLSGFCLRGHADTAAGVSARTACSGQRETRPGAHIIPLTCKRWRSLSSPSSLRSPRWCANHPALQRAVSTRCKRSVALRCACCRGRQHNGRPPWASARTHLPAAPPPPRGCAASCAPAGGTERHAGTCVTRRTATKSAEPARSDNACTRSPAGTARQPAPSPPAS